MKLSEAFEGDNSSLKKTFEEAARHDPENKACAQAGYGDNYHGLGKIDCTCPAQKEECPACNGDIHAKFTVVADFPLLCEKHKNQIDGHLAEIANTPAQKEDPFSDFMKSQGINVVDVTPTQKEECRNDRNLEMIGVISLFQSKVYDTEQLYKEMEEIFKKDCRSQISQAEARGREKQKMDCETGHMVDDYAEHLRGLEETRLSTITAFEEWAGKYMTETTKYYGTDKHGIDPDDLLSFASFLKSNAPKV